MDFDAPDISDPWADLTLQNNHSVWDEDPPWQYHGESQLASEDRVNMPVTDQADSDSDSDKTPTMASTSAADDDHNMDNAHTNEDDNREVTESNHPIDDSEENVARPVRRYVEIDKSSELRKELAQMRKMQKRQYEQGKVCLYHLAIHVTHAFAKSQRQYIRDWKEWSTQQSEMIKNLELKVTKYERRAKELEQELETIRVSRAVPPMHVY
jgi:hypothetical protein